MPHAAQGKLLAVNIVPSPSSLSATGGLIGAIERGRAARQAWTQDGTLLTSGAYAAARGISPAALPELEARGELFSLDVDGARWYPSELLKLSPDEAAALCRELTGDDRSRQLVFLMRTHGALGGCTVAAALAQGQLAAVLRLAHAWRHEPQPLAGLRFLNASVRSGLADAELLPLGR